MEQQKVVISHDLRKALTEAIGEVSHDRLFILTDDITRQLCLPVIADFDCVQGAHVITIGATDANKTLDSLSHVWSDLQRKWGNTPFAYGEPGRRHGDRPGRICSIYIQARYIIYQYSYYAAIDGGCQRGR